MKKTIKTVLALIGAVSIASCVKAQSPDRDYRVSAFYSGNLKNSNSLRTTFGIAPNASYDGAPIPLKGQFLEYFRAYDIFQENNGNTIHYLPIGIRSPNFSLGGIESKATVFGSIGDTAGLGFESEHKLPKDITLTLNVESRTSDTAARLGAGLTKQLTPNLNIGFAYDYVQTQSEQNQFLINGIYDISKRTSLGLSLVTTDNRNGGLDLSLGGFWVTSGDKDQWGAYLQTKVDWNSKIEGQIYSGEFIVSKAPSTGKAGGTWAIGRGVSNDDIYNPSILPLSVSRFETPNLFDRSWGGPSYEIRGEFNSKTESGFVTAGAAYMSPNLVFKKTKPGAQLEIRHTFSNGQNETFIEPSLIWRMKFGDHYTGPVLGASIPITGKSAPIIKIGGVWTW